MITRCLLFFVCFFLFLSFTTICQNICEKCKNLWMSSFFLIEKNKIKWYTLLSKQFRKAKYKFSCKNWYQINRKSFVYLFFKFFFLVVVVECVYIMYVRTPDYRKCLNVFRVGISWVCVISHNSCFFLLHFDFAVDLTAFFQVFVNACLCVYFILAVVLFLFCLFCSFSLCFHFIFILFF